MINSISNACQAYYDDLPTNIFPTVGKSAIFTFIATFLSVQKRPGETMNLSRPLAATGYAVLASTIHSFTNPIFNKIFGDNDIRSHREFIKMILNSLLATTIIMYLTAGKVDVAAYMWFENVSINFAVGLGNDSSLFFDFINDGRPGYNPQDPNTTANVFRWLYSSVGLNVVPGAGSVYIAILP